MISKIDRRSFLSLAGLVGAGLTLQFPLLGFKEKKASDVLFDPNGFLHIHSDGQIILFAKNPEIGQGVKTSLPMIVAEELEVDLEQVSIRFADVDSRLGSQFAGGSTAVKTNFELLRKAGAAGREMLRQAAAQSWQTAIDNCRAEAGFIHHHDGRKIAYGELAEAAAQLPVPEDPPLKSLADFRLIGRPTPNVDNDDIVRGKPVFGMDQRPEGALVACIKKCPVFGGKVKSFDRNSALKVKGVIDVVEIEPTESPTLLVAGVAVLAKNTWAAMKGKDALKVEWEYGEGLAESSEKISELFSENVNKEGSLLLRNDGEVQQAFAEADAIIEATFEVPLLYHATMEPVSYIADVRENQVECWGPTQVPGGIPGLAQRMTGMDRADVLVHQSRMGGGFGRRLAGDYAAEAIYLSQKVKQAVQVIWTREDDVQHDFYRPAGMYKLKGGIKNKQLNAWHIKASTTSRYLFRGSSDSPHKTEVFPDGFPAGFVPNFRMEYTPVATKIPTGAWRAPGHNATAFVDQSFIDMAAHAAGRDPVEFRLELLGEEDKEVPYDDHGGPTYSTARLKNVIRKAAEFADWKSAPKKGRWRGFASHFMFGAYVAEVVDLEMQNGKPLVKKVWVAVDCGIVVNPLGAKAQIEGGIIDGLGAAMYGKVPVAEGRAAVSNFDGYPMIRLAESPEVEVLLVESEESPEGLGEVSLPIIGAAVCNALFSATGKRFTKLPLMDNPDFS